MGSNTRMKAGNRLGTAVTQRIDAAETEDNLISLINELAEEIENVAIDSVELNKAAARIAEDEDELDLPNNVMREP